MESPPPVLLGGKEAEELSGDEDHMKETQSEGDTHEEKEGIIGADVQKLEKQGEDVGELLRGGERQHEGEKECVGEGRRAFGRGWGRGERHLKASQASAAGSKGKS